MRKGFANNKAYLYYVLLAGTLIILLAMLILDKSILNYKHESVRQGINYDSEEISKSINGLLLSANELTISEKTAFINLYLKTGELPNKVNIQNIGKRRSQVYSNILNRKKESVGLSGKQQDDFFIRSVPK